MDEKLPKIDGYQVLNQLQTGGSTKAIPVIMFCSGPIIENEALAIKVGAQSCIGKSTDLETLLLNIRVAIREGEKNRSERREESSPDRKPVETEVQDALAPPGGGDASAHRLVSTRGLLSQLEQILGGWNTHWIANSSGRHRRHRQKLLLSAFRLWCPSIRTKSGLLHFLADR